MEWTQNLLMLVVELSCVIFKVGSERICDTGGAQDCILYHKWLYTVKELMVV